MRDRSLALLWLLLLFGLAACAGRRDPSLENQISPPAESGQPSQENPDKQSEQLRQALTAFLERGNPESWRLSTWCLGKSGPESLQAFSNGVAVWGQRKQFHLDPYQLHTLLDTLQKYDFPGMRLSYGGKNDPLVPESNFATRITCQVEIGFDGIRKASVQLYGGRQYEPLREMAQELLSLGRSSGERGVVAKNLSDALNKMARGDLAPELLRLILNRPPAKTPEKSTGWILRVEEGRISRVSLPLEPGALESQWWPNPDEIRQLATVLASSKFADLPNNLYADGYTDLRIEVLDFEKSIQARPFSGINRQTHGLQQERFEEILRFLQELQLRRPGEGQGKGS